MFHEYLSESDIVVMDGTSEGTQIKYRKGDYWYKEDNRGREGLTEYLVSHFLTFTDLQPEEYVLYEQGYINGERGCRSKNFLMEHESLLTFYRLYYSEFGGNLAERLAKIPTMEERIAFTLKMVRSITGLDVTDYLKKVLMLDMVVLNEDRHVNNLAVIFDGSKFRPAPIFDNGISLLTANVSVNWHFQVEENVKRVIARPFSGSHEKMYEYFGKGFSVDWDGFLYWLDGQEETKEKEVFLYQAKRYRNDKLDLEGNELRENGRIVCKK